MIEWLEKKKNSLPEVSNMKAKDPNFWRNYWQTDAIKWHSPEVSPWLRDLCKDHLTKGPKKTVYFPLCGKAIDMLWMHKEFGYKVIGSDCSQSIPYQFSSMISRFTSKSIASCKFA